MVRNPIPRSKWAAKERNLLEWTRRFPRERRFCSAVANIQQYLWSGGRRIQQRTENTPLTCTRECIQDDRQAEKRAPEYILVERVESLPQQWQWENHEHVCRLRRMTRERCAHRVWPKAVDSCDLLSGSFRNGNLSKCNSWSMMYSGDIGLHHHHHWYVPTVWTRI